MSTNSARPDALDDHASRLRREAQLVDDAIRAVFMCQAAYASHCADGRGPGTSALLARAAADQVADVGQDLRSVAGAFRTADRGSGLHAVSDAALAGALVRTAPGLASEAIIRDGMAHERGRQLGHTLARASPADVAASLERQGSALADPAFASGLLQGLGPRGLSRLAREVQRDGHALGGSPDTEAQLWTHLARAANAGARTVHPLPSPGANPQVDPGGFDLSLIDQLATSWSGRLALRQLVERMHQPPAAVTASLADALLLGPTAANDLFLAGTASTPSGLIRPPGSAGEMRSFTFLARDPMASFRLELLHPTGPSPALLLLQRDGWNLDPGAAAHNLQNVAITSVDRGWAAQWADPAAGRGATYRRLPVPRLLDQLVPGVVDLDARRHVSPTLSRTLAGVVATHPAAFEVATAEAALATTEVGQQDPTHFYEAIARDKAALDDVTAALANQHRSAIAASVTAQAPGSTQEHTTLLDTTLSHRSLEMLIDGAHEAGREHHVGVMIASVLGTLTVGAGLPTLGKVVGGPAGAWVSTKVASAAKGEIADYREDHEYTYDGRERDAKQELDRGAPLAAAIAMSNDAAWAPLLRFPAGGLGPQDLARLDVGGRDQDQQEFEAWRDAQDDDRVTEVLESVTPSER